jgi:ferredoxin-nitrate reductase
VLPAATWGEKLGTFTNADRTVHLSEKAVDPPGEARADLDIFLDYARRMELRDRDGEPLVGWSDPESAFRAWQRCSRGRPCDYGELSYESLRQGGKQWGGERLYADGRFFSRPDECETYGRDLETGAELEAVEYRSLNPDGKAVLKAARYSEAPETPDDDYPLVLTTGRTLWQFHTRTKTGRAPELNAQAPEQWVELSDHDAGRHGIADGQDVEVESPRGRTRGKARIGDVRSGVVFVPFHYGGANELTRTAWDPASKQPLYKVGAVSVRKVER